VALSNQYMMAWFQESKPTGREQSSPEGLPPGFLHLLGGNGAAGGGSYDRKRTLLPAFAVS
jgi:hypothetical protein